MGFSLGKSLGGLAGGGALFGMIGQPAMELGGNMILSKYASDLQGHQIDKSAEYDRNMAVEMFNKQAEENEKIRKLNIAQEQSVFERNVASAKEFRDEDRAYNLELWNKQNEYNSPAAQMARFKAAGLNPRLIYGQGNAGNAVAVSASHTESPNMDAVRGEAAHAERTTRGVVNQGELVMGAINNYTRMRQVGLMTQQLALDTALKNEQTESMRIENDMNKIILERMRKTGTDKFDSPFYRGVKRALSDSYDFGKDAAKKMSDWFHHEKALDWDGVIRLKGDHEGVPGSMVPGNGETHPVPVNITEPDWMQ